MTTALVRSSAAPPSGCVVVLLSAAYDPHMPFAAVLACVIVAIANGDSLTTCCDVPAGKVNVTVRVAEIDAPETGQAWRNRSKQHRERAP